MMSLLMTRSQQQAPRLEEPASTIAKSRAEEKLRWWPCSRQRRLWERTSQIMYRTILNLSTCISTDINKNTLLQWHIDKFVKVEKREARIRSVAILRIYESSLFPFGNSFVKSEIHAPFFSRKIILWPMLSENTDKHKWETTQISKFSDHLPIMYKVSKNLMHEP